MKQLKITTLGDFSISYGNKTISETSRRSNNLWSMLEFFVAMRRKEIPHSEIIELFYDDSKNPVSALKTQISRIRDVLGTLGYKSGKDLLKSCVGGYKWDVGNDCVIDADEFEKLCNKAFSADDNKPQQLKYITDAIMLYRGDYLPSQSGEAWSVPITAYYHNLYVRAVHLACELMYEKKMYDDLILLCKNAVLIEPYDEKIHIFLIRALSESGNSKEANVYYLYAVDLFYNKLGINPSDKFLALYDETVKNRPGAQVGFDTVMEFLSDDNENAGAFQCEYEFFKHIYKIESRASMRDGRHIYLAILTLSPDNATELSLKKQNALMEKLVYCVKYSLRNSDIFARLSLSQYIILLETPSLENAQMVMERIIKRFKKDNPKKHVTLTYALKSVTKDKKKTRN